MQCKTGAGSDCVGASANRKHFTFYITVFICISVHKYSMFFVLHAFSGTLHLMQARCIYLYFCE